jgi:hypothetical protein
MFQCVREPRDPLGQYDSEQRGCSLRRNKGADAGERFRGIMDAYRIKIDVVETIRKTRDSK